MSEEAEVPEREPAKVELALLGPEMVSEPAPRLMLEELLVLLIAPTVSVLPLTLNVPVPPRATVALSLIWLLAESVTVPLLTWRPPEPMASVPAVLLRFSVAPEATVVRPV